jgi:hypothetical protein
VAAFTLESDSGAVVTVSFILVVPYFILSRISNSNSIEVWGLTIAKRVFGLP